MHLLQSRKARKGTCVGRDVVLVGVIAIVVSSLAIWFRVFDVLYDSLDHHDHSELDQFLSIGFIASIALLLFSWRRVKDLRREIEARTAAEERATYLAQADALTGLPNRRRLEPELEAALAGMAEGEQRAFMIIDLNRFKPVNDIYGHQTGDKVLIEVANRISGAVNKDCMAFRLGGDEFAVLSGPFDTIDHITRAARRIVSAMTKPIEMTETTLTIGAGIGIAVAPDDGTCPGELMRRADIALYRAKRSRVNGFHFFEPEMDKKLLRRSRLEADMLGAIKDGSIRISYQPIVRIEDRKILGFEALAHWTHPEHGAVSAKELISVADECGMMPQLSRHLLKNACADAAQWPSDLFLAINVTRSDLSDQSIALRIINALGESGLPAHRLEIEVPSGILLTLDPEANRVLETIQDIGVNLTIDNFGAGSYWLKHLKTLRFERLKIDRSCVANLPDSHLARTALQATLTLTEGLDIRSTAKGVEDDRQLASLISEGCSEGQGYYFARPVSADRIPELLEVPLADTGS